VQQLNGTERTKHDLIDKLSAIVAHCDLLELWPNAHPDCTERLTKIKALAMESAEMVLTCAAEQPEYAEEQPQLFA
jgi:hypothetical protein